MAVGNGFRKRLGMNETIKKTGEETIHAQAEAGAPRLPSTSRRRLVQAGLAAAPVVLALSGRSAMAGTTGGTTPTCLSPIAWVSANPKTGTVTASHTPRSSGTPGCTPVKWKPCEVTTTFPNVPKWPSDCKPFDTIYPPNSTTPLTWSGSNCQTYSGLMYQNTTTSGTKVDPGWSTGTKLTWLDSRSCSNLLIAEARCAEDNKTKFPLSSADVINCYMTKTLGGRAVSDADLLAFFKQTCA